MQITLGGARGAKWASPGLISSILCGQEADYDFETEWVQSDEENEADVNGIRSGKAHTSWLHNLWTPIMPFCELI